MIFVVPFWREFYISAATFTPKHSGIAAFSSTSAGFSHIYHQGSNAIPQTALRFASFFYVLGQSIFSGY